MQLQTEAHLEWYVLDLLWFTFGSSSDGIASLPVVHRAFVQALCEGIQFPSMELPAYSSLAKHSNIRLFDCIFWNFAS